MPINLICLMNRHCILFAKSKAPISSNAQYLGSNQESLPDFYIVHLICGKDKLEKLFNYLYLGRFFKHCPETNCCLKIPLTYTIYKVAQTLYVLSLKVWQDHYPWSSNVSSSYNKAAVSADRKLLVSQLVSSVGLIKGSLQDINRCSIMKRFAAGLSQSIDH